MHENSQTEGVGNEVRQRASKDLANNLNLAVVTIYTFLLFFPVQVSDIRLDTSLFHLADSSFIRSPFSSRS